MAYRMTPARKAALRKAQQASARKRKGKGNPRLKASHAKSRRNGRRIAKAGLAVAAVGAVGYATHKGNSVRKRKNAAIKDTKELQAKYRNNLKEAKAAAKRNPSDKRAKTMVKVHRRALRISTTRSVHKAVIKKHTGR